jgi:23S rRNA (guanosine2251-2'-O)-methyltransferase
MAMQPRDIVVIAHDIRSTHNIGSLLRTCEGIGVSRLFFTGYTPYPRLDSGDTRLPHIADKLTQQIHKTALDAETLVPWSHLESVDACRSDLKALGFTVVALEQSPGSVSLPNYDSPDKVALLLGREVEGIEPELLRLCDATIEIPMLGKKESFNVVQAAAMCMYKLRFE